MSPTKDFIVTYEALNKEDVFSAGDTVKGTVTFTLTKDTEVKSVHVKVKGDARVSWTEGTGDRRKRYTAHRRYCKVKQYLVAENSKGTELSKGEHRYNFTLKIPQGDLPSSFKGFHGSIVYRLEAKIPRSWRIPSTAQRELKFVAKAPHHGQGPKFGSVGKEGVKMSATVDRTVCSPGDTLSISATICNSSSKTTRPKFSLQQTILYRAIGSRKYSYQSLCKMVGEPITPNSEVPVSCQLKIPHDTPYTVNNCDILTVEYHLKVYLDIKFAIDPEVVFPLLIVSSSSATHHPGQAVGPHPAGAVGAPSYSDFPPGVGPAPAPAFPTGPYPAPPNPGAAPAPAPVYPTGPYPVPAGPGAAPAPAPAPAYPTGPYPGPIGPGAGPPPAFPFGPFSAPAGSGAYGYPAPGPTQQANTTSGYNNPWPQQDPPYGYPAAPFPPSSVQHPAPAAPPMSQQGGGPPAYMTLFPPSHNTSGSSEADKKN
ncbi:arrestin domain-containing protein 3-like [Symphorus nematophorus]